MIEAVKQSRTEIDKKVTEQTKELKERADKMDQQQKAILNILDDVEEEKNKSIKLASIVENANEAIIAKTIDGIIIEWNGGAENLYEWKATEIIGRSIKLIVPKEKYTELEDIMARVAKGEFIEHYQTIRVKKSGQKVDVSLSVSPIKDSNGEITGISVIAIDITKEKQVDRAKTEFVSLASHQLRTPLSTINWYTEMLLGGDAGKINKQQKKFLEEIYAGNKRMVDLVNALLNVSRIELGTLAIDPEICDIVELAKQSIADVLPQIKNKKQKFIEKYDKDLPKINVDPKLMNVIFQNLLSNSMKYTPEKGSISLFVKNNKEGILIEVSDNGYGIPKEAQSKIFEKLYRADNIKEKDTNGSGLGLYLIKFIVEHSGGRVWFESEVNKGTSFYVLIPFAGMAKREGVKKLS